MAQPHDPLESGRLTHTLATRHVVGSLDPEAPLPIPHRDALIYTLGKAAELEHLVICQYLFTAFSLKRDSGEGLTADQLNLARRWSHELMEIAEQEMLHLALVQNLLTAIGAGPHFGRPNFPVPPRAFPARIQIVLMPFGEPALRHFAFLERPEGMAVDDFEGMAALDEVAALPMTHEDEIGPIVPDFQTISHLYRSIEDAFSDLAGKWGEEALFIGPVRAQATGDDFQFPELVPVTDLDSAKRAIDTIVEQGEGARGEWRQAHFGRLLSILDEFVAARDADATFQPARPVLAARVRPGEDGAPVPLITEHFTVRCMDLLNAIYEVTVLLLARYFAHADETDEQLAVLADVAVELMEDGLAKVGRMVTGLPIGNDHPGFTAGPTFEVFYATDYLLPHRQAAWRLIVERLNEVADFATSCKNQCPPGLMGQLAIVAEKLREQAARLAAAA
jgi:hypothetical protein